MSIAKTLLAEFEQECVTTRKFLERLPDDKLSWKPHDKSLSAGTLALHIAQTPGSVVAMAQKGSIDMSELSPPSPDAPPIDSRQDVLDALDASIATVKEILPTLDDAQMQSTWRLTAGPEELLAMPIAGLLRSVMLNHWYHHRGQFGVYLRLMGCKVPSAYGPSGDESPDFLNDRQLTFA